MPYGTASTGKLSGFLGVFTDRVGGGVPSVRILNAARLDFLSGGQPCSSYQTIQHRNSSDLLTTAERAYEGEEQRTHAAALSKPVAMRDIETVS